MEENLYQPPGSQELKDQRSKEHIILTRKQNLFSFKGRMNRSRYWGYMLGSLLILFIPYLGGCYGLAYFSGSGEDGIGGEETKNLPLAILSGVSLVVSYFIILWTSTAIHVKRWHDRDKSGWIAFIGVIPLFGSMWTLIECGMLKGTEGPNRYGRDPLQKP